MNKSEQPGRSIHQSSLVIDMHCDTIGRYMEEEDLAKDLLSGQIDIPKLKRASVGLEVFAAYVAVPRNDAEKNGAAMRAFQQIDAIHRLIDENSKDLSLVLRPREIAPFHRSRKTGILIAIEGGYAIQNDLSLLRSFYRNGVRLMTLTHWNRTDWADASGDKAPELGGLTEFGEEVIKEMNRLGMIIDVSHAHDETFWDVLRISTKPVVASHSCARALAGHFRNLTDDMLQALAKNGGMVGINFAPAFLNFAWGQKQAEIQKMIAAKYGIADPNAGWDKVDAATRRKAQEEFGALMAQAEETVGQVNIKTVADHIDHVVKITGSADHVGLGSDFDGIGAAPKGLENIGSLPAITDELKARGYKDPDIRKFLGGNFQRVFGEVAAGKLR